MLNIHELEKSWLHYKIKYYLPRVIALFLTLGIIVSIRVFWSDLFHEENIPTQETTIKSVTDEQSKEPAIVKTGSKETLQSNSNVASTKPESREQAPLVITNPEERPLSSQDGAKPSVTLKPSMGFMHHIEEDISRQPERRPIDKPVYTAPPKPLPQRKIVKAEPIVEQPAMPVVTEVVEQPKKVIDKPKSQISIITKENENDLKEVIKRFKKNKSPALSLFIAKRYYELGNYQKAYNYALTTNDINSEIEESWIIFAKSLVKLGQKEMAIKTLTTYSKEYDSTEAKILLEEIKKGSFK